ncbi:M3 family metallopeptidase [Streptomyces sp. B93]|uniref:M3 family metallopeptidase n=1 Tax=Streptomyces sp. B93 TaxID=2824875 RepID=UPI001B397775|nr:M3 family metallopeptidase [Streptomyces sp. B93]MBQ1089383.1 hypothetical protein [Streptomyces sp. B93]
MLVDTITGLDQVSLQETHEMLRRMKARLDEILAGSTLTEASFAEATAIYDNVAYVFLYLESNEEFVNYEWLLPYRDTFFRNAVDDARLLALCGDLHCTDSDIEASRLAYVEHLTAKRNTDQSRTDRLEQLQASAKDIVRAGQRDQLDLLGRLGLDTRGGSPEALAYTLISTTADASRRVKLSRAMEVLRDKRREALAEVIDRKISVRREISKGLGHATVLSETLRRSSVPGDAIRRLIDAYVVTALQEHAALESEIRETVTDTGPPMDHFGHYVRRLQGDLPVPLFDLRACLAFLTEVAQRVFGLRVRELPTSGTHVLTVSVSRGDEILGYINFDLWESDRKRIAANTTQGIRNRADWGGIVQHPVAYVSCRFHRRPDGRDLITFQNVHSLFHEFGHAVNHILIRKRLPTQSGLDYLPLERIENLSMWSEKWVYHPDLAEHFGLSAEERVGLDFCRRVKVLEYRRTHVDRAVTAALDFEVHGGAATGVREAFDALDNRFGISRHCDLGEFLPYFTWPMINTNPGASFTYLWGAAASAEMFAPLLTRRLSDLDPAEFEGTFTACFEFDEPSIAPDVQAVFDFYDATMKQSIS